MLRANAAMLMFARVPLALFRTGPARGRACLHRRCDNLLIAAGPTSAHGARGETQIRTVEIEPDALAQLFDHLLGKTGVGA